MAWNIHELSFGIGRHTNIPFPSVKVGGYSHPKENTHSEISEQRAEDNYRAKPFPSCIPLWDWPISSRVIESPFWIDKDANVAAGFERSIACGGNPPEQTIPKLMTWTWKQVIHVLTTQQKLLGYLNASFGGDLCLEFRDRSWSPQVRYDVFTTFLRLYLDTNHFFSTTYRQTRLHETHPFNIQRFKQH